MNDLGLALEILVKFYGSLPAVAKALGVNERKLRKAKSGSATGPLKQRIEEKARVLK